MPIVGAMTTYMAQLVVPAEGQVVNVNIALSRDNPYCLLQSLRIKQ